MVRFVGVPISGVLHLNPVYGKLTPTLDVPVPGPANGTAVAEIAKAILISAIQATYLSGWFIHD
jgi:hypothetical protein